VNVAFWVNYIQTQLNRQANDNRFVTGQRAVLREGSRHGCISLTFRDYPNSGRQFSANQFPVRRAAVLHHHGRCVSLISLKRTPTNPQF
jgi:hypothetical protein